MICNPVLTSIMLFLNLFARWKQVLQVPHVPVAGSMFVPRPEFHWGATSVHRSGRRLVAGGPVNQWPWLIFMVLRKNGFQVETSFVHEVFVETWMQLFFWVGHLFWWNIIICRLLVYQTNGIPCELPDQALQMLIDDFLETFTLVEPSSRTYQSSTPNGNCWKALQFLKLQGCR